MEIYFKQVLCGDSLYYPHGGAYSFDKFCHSLFYFWQRRSCSLFGILEFYTLFNSATKVDLCLCVWRNLYGFFHSSESYLGCDFKRGNQNLDRSCLIFNSEQCFDEI